MLPRKRAIVYQQPGVSVCNKAAWRTKSMHVVKQLHDSRPWVAIQPRCLHFADNVYVVLIRYYHIRFSLRVSSVCKHYRNPKAPINFQDGIPAEQFEERGNHLDLHVSLDSAKRT